jgi:molecular chaperone HscC
LDQQQIQEAVERMQKLKYYPREDLKNQRLLRFCERLVGEISPYQRAQLEAAIDSFEAAMGEGDRVLVEHAQLGLLQTLSSLGIEYRTGDA